nr:MAG TPA: hypothetical protein [Caudoviricetes sp.]
MFASLSLCLCCNYMSHACKCQYCFATLLHFYLDIYALL